ncbi:MAG: hypothetical protein PVI57_19990 [Gemmatimonadota bacterium]|jgi:hypothetical protein
MPEGGRENGEIVIPSQEWVEFKEKVRAGYNAEQERRYRLAISAYEMTLEAKKAADGPGWKEAGRRVLDRLDLEGPVRRAVHRAMYRNGPTKRPLKPRKMDFPEANNRTTELDLDGQATVTFDNDTRTTTWSAPAERSDAETVRQAPVAKAFFEALEAIGRRNGWTAHSGGEISAGRNAGGPRVLAAYGTPANRENTARYRDTGPR